ncbi:HEPN domain-containing protein [Streptomyces sp. NBC_00101]|uniref:HEPN domain-containing protein n=1 Tax=Streptomyces sp. NBC_00101 TaxID=2975651 RepID=UPI00386501E5
MYLNAAWRRCSERFDEVSSFIDASSSATRSYSSPSIRSDLYGGWVLLSYASCQFALDEIGKGSMLFLGSRYKDPSRLPDSVLRAHEKLSFESIKRSSESDRKERFQVRQALKNMYSKDWAAHSPLLNIERNVWPDNVREWLRRLGVEDADLSWMIQPVPGSTETYSSRLKELVSERNPIAHGQAPSQLLSAQMMKGWLSECRDFMEHCSMTVELHLSRAHNPRLRSVGSINRRITLGNRTIPISKVTHALRVGDHVLLASGQERKKIARIDSIKSQGLSHTEVSAGHEAVALGLSKEHQGCGVFLPP